MKVKDKKIKKWSMCMIKTVANLVIGQDLIGTFVQDAGLVSQQRLVVQ